MYRKGNATLIGICCFNILLFIGLKIFYTRINKSRELVWNSMSEEEKEEYLSTTKDQGNKRLDFRFAT